MVAGKMNFPINVKTGPAIIAVIAYFSGTLPGINNAVQSGINATEPRSPMDIKLHPRIKSPRFPQLNTELTIKIATIMILVTFKVFSGVASLLTYTL